MKSLVLKDLFNIGHNAKSMLFILVVFAVALIPFSGVEGYIFVCAILCSIQYRISAMVTGNTLLKKNALIASLLVIGKTSFRSSIIQDAGSCAQRLSKKFIPVHAAAVVPVPLERPAAHPHFA